MIKKYIDRYLDKKFDTHLRLIDGINQTKMNEIAKNANKTLAEHDVRIAGSHKDLTKWCIDRDVKDEAYRQACIAERQLDRAAHVEHMKVVEKFLEIISKRG